MGIGMTESGIEAFVAVSSCCWDRLPRRHYPV